MSLNAIATSAFGRRTVTRAQISAQLAVGEARAAAEETAGQGAGAVHKWTLLRKLSEIRDRLGVSDRALGVLSALLSFHPETALTLAAEPQEEQGEPASAGAYAGLVVFPSNRTLCLRCNGMAEPTLRRHLAALVEAGLIIRRDSPNGKRYARRGADGQGGAGVVQAFGFDLAPLVARAQEFEALVEDARSDARRRRLLKERIALLRRDIAKRLAFATDEGLSGPWETLRHAFLRLCAPLRATPHLTCLASELDALAAQVASALTHALEDKKDINPSGYADQNERHHTESNPDQFQGSEPDFQEVGGRPATFGDTPPGLRDLPLPLVLDACRDVEHYNFAGQPLADWRDFVAAAAALRPMLGISPDAWREAVATLGERPAAVAVAFILQRSEFSSEARAAAGADGRSVMAVNGSPAIRSPGGYLRALTQKGREGGLALWPALLAHLAQRARVETLARQGRA